MCSIEKKLSFEQNQTVEVRLKNLAKLNIQSVPMVNERLSESPRVSCWVVVCFGGASRWSMAKWLAVVSSLLIQ